MVWIYKDNNYILLLLTTERSEQAERQLEVPEK